ncbi:MAG: hypothetical protein JXR12_06370 [Neptunomonas phycophila]|uniref:hypothetical protein n=1 Tax=Neptunomonas phycophila TaxID=1572645 RepID=UPI003B8B8D4F
MADESITQQPTVRVALDFDDTYTKDPATWQKLVSTMKEAGWDVRIVTFRDDVGGYNNHDIKAAASVMDLPIIFTAGKQKSVFCRKVGFVPSFWIDDLPYLIPNAEQMAGMVYGCIRNNDV